MKSNPVALVALLSLLAMPSLARNWAVTFEACELQPNQKIKEIQARLVTQVVQPPSAEGKVVISLTDATMKRNAKFRTEVMVDCPSGATGFKTTITLAAAEEASGGGVVFDLPGKAGELCFVVANVQGRTGGKVKRVFQLKVDGFPSIAVAVESNDSTKCLPLDARGCDRRGGPPCCGGYCVGDPSVSTFCSQKNIYKLMLGPGGPL